MNNNTNEVKMKVCSKCNEEKPLTTEYFNRRKASRDGFYGQCTDCRVAYNRQHRKLNAEKVRQTRRNYYEENREEIINKSKEYYEKNRERIAIRRKRYYKENREWFLDNRRRYYEENKEEHLKRMRRYVKENPHVFRKTKQKRKAKKRNLPHTLTHEQWNNAKLYFDKACSYCGMTEAEHVEKYNQTLHQEHFIPLSEGGEYMHNNIIPACVSCNSSKRDRDFFEWYPSYEHYSRTREKKILEFLGYKDKGVQQLSIL